MQQRADLRIVDSSFSHDVHERQPMVGRVDQTWHYTSLCHQSLRRSASLRSPSAIQCRLSGVVNVRTHTKTHVVNKLNRCHRTTVLDEETIRPSNNGASDNGTRDPLSSSSVASSHSSSNMLNGHNSNLTRAKRTSHDCIFASAVTLIRQPTDTFVSGLSAPFNIDCLCLASTFGMSRGFLNPEDMINQQEHTPKACSSFFVISWHGRLIEYVLEPIPGKAALVRPSIFDINASVFRYQQIWHANHIRDTTRLESCAESSMAVAEVTSNVHRTIISTLLWRSRLNTWAEVRMSTGYSFLSQGHRPVSANRTHSKDDWLRQVEMNTHVGPHRRLWMGPQFQFKHYSEATVSVCHPNSNVCTADSPQTSMNIVDADLKSLP